MLKYAGKYLAHMCDGWRYVNGSIGYPAHWPAGSPDLTCLKHFLLWYVKLLVYETPINIVEDLVARIAAVVGEVQDMPGVQCRGDTWPISPSGL
ncbi:hypothetical protein TNCV_2460281 [Trichonephila clavipes]|nr:hypothetical protein TNCV_2460281 [Trichonephila clavipes]